MTLSIDDFARYFDAVHGYAPYRWQTELAESVWANRSWPSALDLPTGSGKTAILDVATFVLALDGFSQPDDRWCPRRVAVIVDRRVVVDQTSERATNIVSAVKNATDGVLVHVREGLHRLCSGTPDDVRASPICSAVLRGGVIIDEEWATRPDRPALLASTVDQIGSRLLFSGYGLSRSSRPIHAALLSTNTLLVLDEVHLSQAFASTLEALGRIRGREGSSGSFDVVQMSATRPSSHGSANVFPPSRDVLLDDDALRRRIEATKPATLLEPVKVPADRRKAAGVLAAVMAEAARTQLGQEHVQVCGVIANSVEVARRTAVELQQRNDIDVKLITGRMRPHDREALTETNRLLTTRAARAGMERPLVVCATQTIEAGADFDLDALVTECASADALIQRFGRVDRAGELHAKGKPAAVSVCIRSTSIGSADPIYGEALTNTWAWLQRHAASTGIDVGIAALPAPDPSCLPIPRRAPVLFPEHVEWWARTNPAPVIAPQPHAWLHGLGAASAEVFVAWRREINESLLDELHPEDATDLVSARASDQLRTWLSTTPVLSPELVSVPVWSVQSWLRGSVAPDTADVEGVASNDADDDVKPSPPFVLRTDDGVTVSRDPTSVTPGCYVIVPCEYSGLELLSWSGHRAGTPVPDVAESASQNSSRSRRMVRLDHAGFSGDQATPVPDFADDDPKSTIEAWVETLDHEAREALSFENGFDVATIELASTSWYVLTERKATNNLDDEDDEASFTSSGALLRTHLRGVGEWTRSFASNVGLTPELVDDLELAGRLHDLGKADTRFQAWLLDGALDHDLYAKSGSSHRNAKQRRDARRRSGYPRGTRHELLSLALMEGTDELQKRAHDWDLVCHIVAAHHGRCRPFAPFANDRTPVPVDIPNDVVDLDLEGVIAQRSSQHELALVSSAVAERYFALTGKYGTYGLAYLESLLRLGDHRRSAWEQNPSDAEENSRV